MNFIEKLAKEAEGLVEALKNKRFRGLKDILTDIYHEDAHFIYEILQNAEDAKASKVIFTLDLKGLQVQHNGKRQFNEADILSINSIGDSTKRDDVNQIGKFGIGFKAVFSYTRTPQIYSGKYAFEIHDLVSPKEIEQIPEIAKGRSKFTYFRFPFNHLQKPNELAFEEIKKTIENLPANTILFLQSIEEIRWEITGEDKKIGFIKRSKISKLNHLEIKRKTDKLQKTYWLKFTKKTPQTKKLSAAIAFRLTQDKSKDSSKKVVYKIDGEIQRGDVSIYFPAEKETSNLKFYLHAPFAATVARDSIKNQPENLELRDLLVELLLESIPKIKSLGLLDDNFLKIMPNSEDELSEFYKPFQDKIVEKFQNESYTPTWSDNYLPAINLFQGNKEIKKVINKSSILKYLAGNDDVDWVIDVEKGSRVYYFLLSLNIKEWTWRDLFEKIGELFSNQETANKILSNFSDDWLRSFYLLLNFSKEKTSPYYWNYSGARNANIVRLQDNSHTVGTNTFFQTELIKKSKDLSIVKSETYQFIKDKNQTEKAEKFLRDLGVKEFEEKDEIKILLDRHYTSKPNVTEEGNIKHLRKFISFLKRNQNLRSLFFNHFFLRVLVKGQNKKYYSKPSETFCDKPFEKTNLSIIEEFLNKDRKWKLWSGYSKKISNQKDFIQFLRDLGVSFNIKIKRTNISNNPDEIILKQDLTKGAREVGYTSTNEDYDIENLREMLEQKNRKISQLIWEMMCAADKAVLQAKYRPNLQYQIKFSPSKLIHSLKRYAWIPDKEGGFNEPQEIIREMLPDDFPFNNRNGWLTAIGFGTQTEKTKLDEQQKLERLARQLNLTIQELEKAKQWAKMSEEERNEFEDFKQQKIKEKQIKSTENQSKVTEVEGSSSEEKSDSNQSDETEESNETNSFEPNNEVDTSPHDNIDDDEEFEQEIQEEEEANDEEENRIKNSNMPEVEKWQIVKSRSGQGIFRRNVKSIENQCRLTDLKYKKFLVASHIKSWKESSKEEKLDGNNGLLLSPHVDKLFDRGWISFTDNGEILCANDKVKEIMEIWGLDSSKSVGVFNNEQKKYLAYHREKHKFSKSK